MRKFFTLLTMCLLASTAWAATIVFDATVDVGTGSSSSGEFTIVKDGITVHVEQGVANGQHYRFYKNKKVTITSAIGAMTNIVFDCVGTSNEQYGSGGFTSEPGSYEPNGKQGNWTNPGVTQVVFTATNFQVRATKITVVVEDGSSILPIDGVFLLNNELYIVNGVTSISGLQVNPNAIYSFATEPPECDEDTFLGYNAVLHVPGTSFTDYFMADYWCNFADIRNDAVEPASVSLNSYEAELLIGNTMTLSASVSPNNATPNTVVWTTSNPQVAVVDNGMVRAIGEGECDIVASCLDKHAVCHVTVIDPITVTLDKTEVTIEQTQQVTLIATVTPEGANIQNIIWTTSNASVATVNNGIVTGVGLGECDIIASYLDKQAVCHVTVIEATIHITLDKHKARVLPNHMITLTPTTSPLETPLKVTSSDPNVAVARLVNGVVQVAGRAEGTTMVIVGSVDDTAIPDTCVVTVYTENGDVNSDGYVNIADVTDLIDYLLSGGGDSVSQTNADCDKDGNVNIADVTTLIDYLLGGIDLNPPVTETFTVNGVTFRMVVVEGGTFMMGATAEQESEADWDEYPVHQVTLSSYSIGETEVTQALWQAVMGNNPSYFTSDPNLPVDQVSWNSCQTFISKLNELTGQHFRLPTEAEWEFAARGGNKSKGYKYSGGNNLNEVAWYNDNSEDITHVVALKAPNELGIFDMSGNVWERCQDFYDSYGSEPQINPTGPSTGYYVVNRGGGWGTYGHSFNCRVSARGNDEPSYSADQAHDCGLRLAQ